MFLEEIFVCKTRISLFNTREERGKKQLAQSERRLIRAARNDEVLLEVHLSQPAVELDCRGRQGSTARPRSRRWASKACRRALMVLKRGRSNRIPTSHWARCSLYRRRSRRHNISSKYIAQISYAKVIIEARRCKDYACPKTQDRGSGNVAVVLPEGATSHRAVEHQQQTCIAAA